MKLLNIKRNIIIKATKGILIVLIAFGIILFNKNLDLEKLKEIHIEKEKENGVKEVNQALYQYNTQTTINKLILTDYQYLWILPEISQLFKDGAIQNLEPSSPILTDESVGFLLWTPSPDNSKVMPDFIETAIKTGQYKEIFNYDGYRFIKIR
jgi:hypothetical protein